MNEQKNIAVEELIHKMADDLAKTIDLEHVELIGIQTGGMLVANEIGKIIKHPRKIGSLNISFYRDDYTRNGLHPQVTPSNLPFDVENKTIILIDDVLFSGRTIRAALNEIFDYGRPTKVILMILANREEHELPIAPDICGITLKTNQKIKLSIHNNELRLFVND